MVDVLEVWGVIFDDVLDGECVDFWYGSAMLYLGGWFFLDEGIAQKSI